MEQIHGAEIEVSSAQTEAEGFLEAILEDGPVSFETVLKEARSAGISSATLRRAEGSLGIQAKRSGFGQDGEWVWELPETLWRVDTTTEYTDFPEVVIRDMRDENLLGNTVAIACGQFTRDELCQHAHLIAAAPDLLEAAKEMVNAIDHWNMDAEIHPMDCAILGLNEAIKRAEVGKS